MSSPQMNYAPVPPPPPVRHRSFAGPIILILLGVLFLLGNLHYISGQQLVAWFGRWWPLLIILWGVIKLLEYMQARRKGYPSPSIGAGGVVLLIFVILMGLGARGVQSINWSNMDGDIQFGPFGSWGGQTFHFEGQQEQPFTATKLVVSSERGAVNIVAWDQPTLKVVTRKQVRASNQDEANKADAATVPSITANGDVVTINANTRGAGSDRFVSTDFEIYVPAKAAVDIATTHGDVTVRQRNSDVRISDQHGDVVLESLQGNADVTLRHGDFRASQITGNVKLDGRLDDVSISDVTGSVQLSGEYFGDTRMARVSKAVGFHSSRTDLDMAKLEGEMDLGSGNLRANAVAGPVRLSTRAKDIHLEDVRGDVNVSNRNGSVWIAATKPGEISVQNGHGDVSVTLPQSLGFKYDIHTDHGDVSSNFPGVQASGTGSRRSAAASGTIGNGVARLTVTTQYGDVSVNKS